MKKKNRDKHTQILQLAHQSFIERPRVVLLIRKDDKTRRSATKLLTEKKRNRLKEIRNWVNQIRNREWMLSVIIMATTILIKGIISIFTYWLQFNILFILCDLDIVANSTTTTTTKSILGLNQINGKLKKKRKSNLVATLLYDVYCMINLKLVLPWFSVRIRFVVLFWFSSPSRYNSYFNDPKWNPLSSPILDPFHVIIFYLTGSYYIGWAFATFLFSLRESEQCRRMSFQKLN